MIIIEFIVIITMLVEFPSQIIITCNSNYNSLHIYYIVIRLKVNKSVNLINSVVRLVVYSSSDLSN